MESEDAILWIRSVSGMMNCECSKCGATIFVHPDFVYRHRYCFCCGEKFASRIEVIDEDEENDKE